MYKFPKKTEMTDKKNITLTNKGLSTKVHHAQGLPAARQSFINNMFLYCGKKTFFLATCKFSFFTKTNPSPKTKSYSFSKFLQIYFEVRVTN